MNVMNKQRPPTLEEAPSQYLITRFKDGKFVGGGLREDQEYRDLGIGEATHGRMRVMHVRARKHMDYGTGWHRHTVDLQFVYVLKGWVRMQCGDNRIEVLHAGDSVHMPGTAYHNVFEWSDDYEGLEIMMPAEFDTIEREPAK